MQYNGQESEKKVLFFSLHIHDGTCRGGKSFLDSTNISDVLYSDEESGSFSAATNIYPLAAVPSRSLVDVSATPQRIHVVSISHFRLLTLNK